MDGVVCKEKCDDGDFPDVNKVLIPMIGMGRAVKFSFTANHKTDISIAFFGVKYVPSGHKAND